MRTILVIDNDEEPMVAEFSIHDATMRTLKLQVSTPLTSNVYSVDHCRYQLCVPHSVWRPLLGRFKPSVL